MNFETYRNYCLAKAGVTADYPFKGECVWMKVGGKLFSISNKQPFKMEGEVVTPFHFINLKSDPERAITLREEYQAIRPGWHQSKKHWNTLYMDGSLSDELIFQLIDEAYELVLSNLSKKERLLIKES